MRYEVVVTIRPKAGLRDPEGSTIADALAALGYDAVAGVHVGRQITLEVDGADEAAVVASVDEMCTRILANTVIEDYDVAVRGAVG